MIKNKKHGRTPILSLLLLIAVVPASIMLVSYAIREFYKSAYPIKHIETVQYEGKKNGVPPSLIYAVIRTESGFDPMAQSSVGARGLMQITEDTLEWVAMRIGEHVEYEDIFNGDTNIKFGTALLRLHIAEFGAYENVLCAYHAGRSNAIRWLADTKYAPDGEVIVHIPFSDTAWYVNKVLETRKIYQRLYGME